MQYFFDTVGTIPEGVGFSYFDGTHLFWLGLFALLTVASCFYYRGLGEKGRQVWRRVIALLIVADELYKQIGLIAFGNWTPSYLPLHLCSINIFLIAYHALRPNNTLGNFLYTVCIPGALAALLFPTWTELPMANFMHTHSFSVHILLALYPIVLTAGGDIRPEVRLIPRCLLLLLAMAIPVGLLNPLLDSNYFFLASVEKGNPLYIFQQIFGHHYVGFPILIAAVLLVMHGPIVIYKKLHKKSSSRI